jgi:hypothetical protein
VKGFIGIYPTLTAFFGLMSPVPDYRFGNMGECPIFSMGCLAYEGILRYTIFSFGVKGRAIPSSIFYAKIFF